MMSTKDTFEMSGPLAHLKPPDPTASVDERLDFIDVQLDSFGKDPVLTIYECLGASERRRGGLQPSLATVSFPLSLIATPAAGVQRVKLVVDTRAVHRVFSVRCAAQAFVYRLGRLL
ncbi:MAG: hypothetical protein HC767_14780 [Akkermansiaceae bacterium]|nr:hypothetical protein [Akkermansiaceae bacterium]